MAKILVVEDDRATGQLMLTLAESMGHSAALANDGESALTQVRANPPEMIISDVLMEPMDGLELLEIVRREFPQIAVHVEGYAVTVPAAPATRTPSTSP